MYPHLENSNPEALRRVHEIAAHDPRLLADLVAQLTETVKRNIYAFPQAEIEQLIADFREVPFPPLAEIPPNELGVEMAKHISCVVMAEQVSDFEDFEAYLLLTALFLYFADERAHPGRPVTFENYSIFFPVEGAAEA